MFRLNQKKRHWNKMTLSPYKLQHNWTCKTNCAVFHNWDDTSINHRNVSVILTRQRELVPIALVYMYRFSAWSLRVTISLNAPHIVSYFKCLPRKNVLNISIYSVKPAPFNILFIMASVLLINSSRCKYKCPVLYNQSNCVLEWL